MRNPTFVCLSLVFLIQNSFASDRLLDGVKAVVGDTPILVSELDKTREEISKSPALLSAYKLEEKFTMDQLLERLIEDAIIQQKVKELDIKISPSEVETQIANIARQYQITKAQLEQKLREDGIDPATYRKNIQTQLERRDFFDRTLRRGGGISEAELRALYERLAPFSYRIYSLSAKPGTPAAKNLEIIRDAEKQKSAPIEEVITRHKAQEQGWISIEDLEEKARKAIDSAGTNLIIGPLTLQGTSQLLFIAGKRKGSDEEFAQLRNELMSRAQAEDFEKRLVFWLESQKKELQIVRN